MTSHPARRKLDRRQQDTNGDSMVIQNHFRGKGREDITSDGFLGFGKHEGEHVSELPEAYCRWALDQKWISARLREAISDRLGIDQDEDDTEPSGVLASVAFPLIVWKWQETMRAEFSRDFSALLVVERGLAELKTLCSEYTNRPWLEGSTP
jgi:hypothetical protein